MAQQIDHIVDEMHETRQSLADKIETLEKRMGETVSMVSENVQGAAQAVQSSLKTVTNAVDVNGYVQRAPWLTLGASIAAGLILGKLTQRQDTIGRLGRELISSAEHLLPMVRSNARGVIQDVSHSATKAIGEAQKAGLGPMMGVDVNSLKAMAVGTALGVVREMVLPHVPRALQANVRQGVDHYIRHVGGNTYAQRAEKAASQVSS